jgi:hypothetical protein
VAHRQWGRFAGLSREELQDLETLDPSRFDRREWVALTWTRQLLTGGVVEEIQREFDETFGQRERARIMALIQLMHLSNLTGNTLLAAWERLRRKRPS